MSPLTSLTMDEDRTVCWKGLTTNDDDDDDNDGGGDGGGNKQGHITITTSGGEEKEQIKCGEVSEGRIKWGNLPQYIMIYGI